MAREVEAVRMRYTAEFERGLEGMKEQTERGNWNMYVELPRLLGEWLAEASREIWDATSRG